MYCKYCNSPHLEDKPTRFKNGTIHIERRCQECGRHNQYVGHVSNEDFQIPFGMHKGKMLTELPTDYIEWGVENLKGGMQRRFKQELRQRDGHKEIRQEVRGERF